MAATKLLWLALRNIYREVGPRREPLEHAMNQFAILYEGRFTKPAVK